jgi:hypothetical protein
LSPCFACHSRIAASIASRGTVSVRFISLVQIVPV